MLERAVGRWLTIKGIAAAAVVAAALAVFWAMGGGLERVPLSLGAAGSEALSTARADASVRRSRAALQDAQAFWRRHLRDRLGRDMPPATVVYFQAQTPSPCAGDSYAAGPFYCAATQTAYIDLGFVDEIGEGLMQEGDIGVTLFVGRVFTAHVQEQLGWAADWRRAVRGAAGAERRALDLAQALQADCLTGLWAGRSAAWIRAAPPALFGRMIENARSLAGTRPWGATLPDPALLGPGRRAEREAAFLAGRGALDIGACGPPR